IPRYLLQLVRLLTSRNLLFDPRFRIFTLAISKSTPLRAVMEPTANIHPNVSNLDRPDEMNSIRQDLADFVNAEEQQLDAELRVGENITSRGPNLNSASTQAPGQEPPSSRLQDAYISTQERMPPWFRVAMAEAMSQNRSSIMGAERPWVRLMIEALDSSHRPREPAQNQPPQPVQPNQARANRGQRKKRRNSGRCAYWKAPKMTKSEKKTRAIKARIGKIDGLSPLAMADLATKFMRELEFHRS
ncbi:hypothetical protein FA13DRAFT_165929, partial [Coprinellus micaceus]